MTNEELITGLRHIAHTMERNGHSYYQHVAEDAIKALEQTSWIPVSERLPEVDERYLTTVKGYNCNKIRSFTNNLYVIDKYEFSGRKAGWYFYDSEYGYIEETDVIAWMPLPEPYKEDAE